MPRPLSPYPLDGGFTEGHIAHAIAHDDFRLGLQVACAKDAIAAAVGLVRVVEAKHVPNRVREGRLEVVAVPARQEDVDVPARRNACDACSACSVNTLLLRLFGWNRVFVFYIK